MDRQMVKESRIKIFYYAKSFQNYRFTTTLLSDEFLNRICDDIRYYYSKFQILNSTQINRMKKKKKHLFKKFIT